MTGSTTARLTGRAGRWIASRSGEPRRAALADRIRRSAVIALVVGLWTALGFALELDPVPYLLLGIPFTLVFQVVVARRPIRTMWVRDGRPLRLDRAGMVIAVGLALLPLAVTAMGIAGGRVLDVAYGLVGVVGAVPAAYALRAMDVHARRALVRSVLTAGVVASALFALDAVLRDGVVVVDPTAATQAFAVSLLLYVPMVFIIEEVFFRGALDPYARGSRHQDLGAAVWTSLLWGAWHLPLVMAGADVARIAITIGYHLVIGILLTLPWWRSGNLSVPGLTHALIDAVRDGIAAG